MVYATIAFGLFAAVTLAFGLGVVLARDVFHAALLLGGALTSVAVHYVMLQAGLSPPCRSSSTWAGS